VPISNSWQLISFSGDRKYSNRRRFPENQSRWKSYPDVSRSAPEPLGPTDRSQVGLGGCRRPGAVVENVRQPANSQFRVHGERPYPLAKMLSILGAEADLGAHGLASAGAVRLAGRAASDEAAAKLLGSGFRAT
jgi:hypothetical protein